MFCVVPHGKNLNLLLGQVVVRLGNNHFGNPPGLPILKVSSFLPADLRKGAVLVERVLGLKLAFRRERLISKVIMDPPS